MLPLVILQPLKDKGQHTKTESEYADDEIESGIFTLKCINAKRYNKAACAKQRLDIRGLFIMTPQEEKFANFFRNEKLLVAEMDTLQLRAHREELASIAFEARARLTAVDDEERTRKKSKDGIKPFERSVNTDDVTSDAINTIKDRQKKLTKTEKIREGLIKMGMSAEDADKMMSAGTILSLKNKKDGEKPLDFTGKPIVSNPEGNGTTPKQPVYNPFIKASEIPAPEVKDEVKIVVNPFEKKE